MSKTSPFRTIKSSSGPRSPLATAFLTLAAIVDRRFPLALVRRDADGKTYVFATGGDIEIATVFDDQGRFEYVDAAVLTDGTVVELPSMYCPEFKALFEPFVTEYLSQQEPS